MAKEPMNNWVLEVELLQERVSKLEKVLATQLQQQPKPAPAPLPAGAKKDH